MTAQLSTNRPYISHIIRIVVFISILILLSVILISNKQLNPLTEFYILGRNGQASNYPRAVTSQTGAQILVGIINHELAKAEYRVEVYLNGKTLWRSQSINLVNGEKWEDLLTLDIKQLGIDQRVEVLLFLNEDRVPYRHLHFQIDVSE